MTTCLLNEDDLPLKTEIDHLEGNCFCYLCSCGKHACPSTPKRTPYKLKGAFSTNYRSNYSGKNTTPPKPLPTGAQLPPTKGRMDFVTTKEQDYVAHKHSPAKSRAEKRKPSPNFKFMFNSSYNENFVDWKPPKLVFTKEERSYLPSPVKFKANSTYNSEFFKPALAEREARPEVLQSSLVLGARDFTMHETTNRSDYKPMKAVTLPKSVRKTSNELFASESPKNHFNSTYRSSFLSFSPKRNIRTKKQYLKNKYKG